MKNGSKTKSVAFIFLFIVVLQAQTMFTKPNRVVSLAKPKKLRV